MTENENLNSTVSLADPDFSYTEVGADNKPIHESGLDSEILRVSQETGIDPEFIKLDENGKLLSITDIDSGNTFFSDEDAEGDPINTYETPEGGFVNQLDEVLRKSGYDILEIEFEDGSKKNIADLTESEQIEILVQQLTSQSQQEAPANEDFDFTEDEVKLIDYLRSGKTPRELAEAILESDQGFQLSKMSDEDVVKTWMRQERPSYTDEDIEDELRDLKERNKLGREAKAIRAKFNTESNVGIPSTEPDVNTVQQKQDILNFAKGVTIDNKVKNDVLNFILPANDNDDSDLIKYMNTPDALFNMGYMLTQWENIQKNHVVELRQAEERGRRKALGQL